MPRLPLKASLDLTYRCTFNCRHCWLRPPDNGTEGQTELSFAEIRSIVDQARALGTRQWAISGGEPMLRPDFADIFTYITDKATTYSLNTNGSLITPALAKLLRRKGSKMIALYGATAEVCDHITRTPGSFEQAMRGFALLKEAGVGFSVQLIPMRDNFHQWQQMIELAESLSRHWRVGAAWFYLRADGDEERNREIRRQRLAPQDIVALNPPDMNADSACQSACCAANSPDHRPTADDPIYAACIAIRRNFHVDPYGAMRFCYFMKESSLRYDLRRGTVQEGWEKFIPSLAESVYRDPNVLENCDGCELKSDCNFCPVHGFLEHRNSTARVDYLCSIASATRAYKEQWRKNHRRYYGLGGLIVQVDSDLPITDQTFAEKFKQFELSDPELQANLTDSNLVSIRHSFSLPDQNLPDTAERIYHKVPWAIYKNNGSWIYYGISADKDIQSPQRVAIFNHDHSRARIYQPDETSFRRGNLKSLTMFSTDQILFSRVRAIINGKGLLFVGQSSAGKSTLSRMLENEAEVLCDDRNIVRRMDDGFHLYGTWSHGEWPVVSAATAPLFAIFFLEQATDNHIAPAADTRQSIHQLLARLIKPLETADWWEKMFTLIEDIVQQIPCYRLRFDTSGKIVQELSRFCEE